MKRIILFAGEQKSRAWFWWGINLGIVLALLAWWWQKNKPKKQVTYTTKSEPLVLPDDEPGTPSQARVPESRLAEERSAEEPDDLKVIEGLGPRSAQVLSEAGIQTFARLASMEPAEIQAILRASGVRVPYPETWPEQAALAAAGNWEILKALQAELKGGRRI